MEIIDKDLISIQEVRCVVKKAKQAQEVLATFSQEQIDKIVQSMVNAAFENSERLGKMANEETGYGNAKDKKVKNEFASKFVWQSIRDMKTVGIVDDNKEKKVFTVAVPVGVIAGLVPSTNPTSTVIYKAIISIKSGNSIIFSPHPGAKNCIIEATKVVREAAERAGCPIGAINCLENLSMEGTSELMKNKDVNLILATGGTPMVKAAYSSGTPAIGVGPGNGPAFIERSADVKLAVKRIMDSKCFDNGTICASEQSIVVEECIKDKVIEELKKQGAYILSSEEKKKIEGFLMRANGTMNPVIVGKTAKVIAELSGISVPDNSRLLVGCETEVGNKYPFSKEKLCPVIAFYVEKDWESACNLCISILKNEGAGHTLVLHSSNEEVIREFALKKPVSRLLVNTPGALGGIGASTNLAPALTLGCGAVGGSSTSDNITPLNLINYRRIAYGVREIEDIRGIDVNVKNGAEDEIVKEVLKQLYEKFNINN